MVSYDTFVGDEQSIARISKANAEIDVLHSVAIGFIETVHFREERTFYQKAGGGDGTAFFPISFGVFLSVFPGVRRHSVCIEKNACVVDEASLEVLLNIPDGSDLGERTFQFDHRLEPTRGEFEVVVQKNQMGTSRVKGGFVAGCAETEVGLVSKDSVGCFEILQPSGGFSIGSVVDKNQLVLR